jgi:hypothetical protein
MSTLASPNNPKMKKREVVRKKNHEEENLKERKVVRGRAWHRKNMIKQERDDFFIL